MANHNNTIGMPIFQGSKRDKVYMDAVDKNVSRTIIYVKDFDENVSANITPYADEAGMRALSAEELLDAFIKGAVVSICTVAGTEIVTTISTVIRTFDQTTKTLAVKAMFTINERSWSMIAETVYPELDEGV